MPYACPVCDTVEADADHLANHLAITAALHGADHESWLDEHAPDWADRSPSELRATVVERAEKRDVEGTTEHDHDAPSRGSPPNTAPAFRGRDDAEARRDPETERVLREARELTRRATEGSDDDVDA